MSLIKKKYGLLIALTSMLCGTLSSCQLSLSGTIYNPNSYQTYNVHAESSFFNLKYDDSFTLKYNSFFDDPTVYNDGISALCFYSSMEMENAGKVVLSGKKDHSETNNTQFFKDIGCIAVEEYSLYDQYTIDPNDTTRMVVALFADLFSQNFVILTSICGTFELSEWLSNFDIGANTDEYNNVTGEHPDWKFEGNHKGYDVTAKRVNDKLIQFQAKHLTKLMRAKNVTYCFTGYSRGASLANVCAQQLIDTPENLVKPQSKVMAYTFATPATTTAENCKDAKYNSIFNHQAVADPLMKLLPTNLGFKTYGVDISLDLSKIEGGYEAFRKMSGKNYDLTTNCDNLLSILNSVSETRAKVYKVLNYQDCVMTLSDVSLEGVTAKKIALVAKINSLGIGSYVEFDSAEQNMTTGAYEITYRFAFAVFTILLPQVMMNPSLESLNQLDMFLCQRLSQLKTGLVGAALSGGLVNNHLPGSYIIMLNDYWANN